MSVILYYIKMCSYLDLWLCNLITLGSWVAFAIVGKRTTNALITKHVVKLHLYLVSSCLAKYTCVNTYEAY